MKFGFNWPSGSVKKMFEECGHRQRRQTEEYHKLTDMSLKDQVS